MRHSSGKILEFNPGVQSMAFASNVNQENSMSINRALRRGSDDGKVVRDMGAETAHN